MAQSLPARALQLMGAILAIAIPGIGHAEAARSLVPDADITVTVLTTNTADLGAFTGTTQGEWSFAAWVEVGEQSFLFDTGWSKDNVLHNARVMGIDLSVAEDVILSHNHPDHTGGLETLRREMSKANPRALSRIHVAKGIFDSRPLRDGGERNGMVALRSRMEALGSTFIVHEGPAEIAPGVWVTGPVPRVHDETNYPVGPHAVAVVDGETVPDVIAESQSLIITGESGPVMVSGCGHAGLVNSLEYANEAISPLPPRAAIGGFHLHAATDETLEWTADRLSEMQLGHFIGSHCTGFESVYTIRERMGVGPDRALVGAIGTRFEGDRGIVPGRINR